MLLFVDDLFLGCCHTVKDSRTQYALVYCHVLHFPFVADFAVQHMCSDMAWLNKEHLEQTIVVGLGGVYTESL